MPGKCLKRWWQSHLEMLDHTIDFFHFCNNLLTETGLESNIKTPMIYELGPDWVLMDYDPTAISINERKENEANKIILEKLHEACGKVHSKNSVYLMKMIENKSFFIRESFSTKQLIIAGLEVY
jgi:hypothetical protein